MNIVERLLTREEIDALELDLAHAREVGDSGAVSLISARIAHLETALARADRGDSQTRDHTTAHSPRRAA